MQLKEIIEQIKPIDTIVQDAAKTRLDTLIKPIGSLGKLEELAAQLAGIAGNMTSRFDRKAIVIMCADNGVYDEGVSSAAQIVTLMQSKNFHKGITGVGVLSKLTGSDMVVIDIGINSDTESDLFLNRKIRKGTHNLAKEPAMTPNEVMRAIEIGFDETEKLHKNGYSVVGTGEMGIGNTTTSSLVLMALTGCGVNEATGKGAGLTPEAFANKKDVIKKAFELHRPNSNDPIDVLAKVGGFDIAGLVGVYLGAAYFQMPVVIDGVISAAAALTAFNLCAKTREYMVPSHCSLEPGYTIAMNKLGLSPYFSLGMRLGEGSGCPFTFMIIDAAQAIINDMATFEEAAMDSRTLVDIRNA